MIVTCPACTSQFRLPEGALGASGRKLRCSACRHVWFEPAPTVAVPEPVVEDTAAAPGSGGPPVTHAPASERELGDDEPAPVPEEAPAPPDEEPPAWPMAGAATPEGSAGDELAFAADGTPEPAATEPPDAPPEPVVAPEPPAEPVSQRPELRVVPPVRPAEPPAPSYDVRRVVQPDAAPEEPSEPRRRSRGRGLLLAVLLLAGLVAFAVVERETVLRTLPGTAGLYGAAGLLEPASSRGLRLEEVSFLVESEGETAALVVTGTVRNTGNVFRLLPEVRALLLGETRRATLAFDLAAVARGLPPGEATAFAATWTGLPKDGTADYVFVTFADRMAPDGTPP